MWSLHWIWSPDRPDVAKKVLVELSWKTISFYSKTTASNTCIKSWIDPLLLLQDFDTDNSLILFLKLAWNLPSRSQSTTFCSQNWVSFSKSIVVCSIYHFWATLTKNIAVQLCLLLLVCGLLRCMIFLLNSAPEIYDCWLSCWWKNWNFQKYVFENQVL